MKYLQKLFSRKFYRSPLFWGLFLVAIYTIAGFFVVPYVINKTIVAQVEQQLGWKANVTKVEFNPYTYTLAINELTISDQQEQQQVGLSRLYVDFELRSITEGAFTFADIQLLAPTVRVELDKHGVSNFQRAQQQQQLKNPVVSEQPPTEQSDSPLVKLLFDNVDLIDGNIKVIDHTPAQTVTHQLNPITFNLKNFFTYGSQQSTYHLDVSLGKEQTITWDGSFGITPIHSQGALKISGFRVQDYWQYLAEQVPYTLKNALLGITGEYEFSMANEPMQLNISKAAIQIDDIKLANKQQADNFAAIDSIQVGPIDFSLSDKNVQIDTLKVTQLALDVERDKQGMVNLLAPFAETTTDTTAAPAPANDNETDTSASPFTWSIANIIVSDSQVNVLDQQPTTPAQLTVNRINLAVQGVSQDLSKALPFEFGYYIEQSGETLINGEVTATPLNLQAHLTVNALPLPLLQPYINDLAKVNLQQGKLSINGDVNFAHDPQGQIQGDFQGAFNIAEFNTFDTTLNQRLIGWQDFAINPIKVNFNPLSVSIDKVAIEQPYARLVITEDRSMNLAQLAITNEPETNQSAPVANPETTTASETDTAEASAPLDIKIANISINDGEAYFADLSLQPQFATSIDNLSGQINGLSSDNLTRADINLSGTIEEYGKMQVSGIINPLSGDLYTDLKVNFAQIELAPMTPYSGRYVGYTIDKGKLSLALNYQIAKNMLDAQNHLILDQFTLGKKVDSEEAVQLPLKLALALFTDKDGIIDLKLPISGDMNSPDFAIGGILLKTLTNLLTKAVTSPFSLVANLVGGNPDKLKALTFNVGQATLSAEHIDQLNTLAKVLKSRPKLVLEIRPMVDQQQDRVALQAQKMRTLLTTAGINNSLAQQQRIALTEQLVSQYNGAQQLSKLQLDMQAAITTLQSDPEKESKQQLIMDKYEQSLQQRLQDQQPLTDLELTELAQQRVKVIKTQLIEQNQVADKQVFALQPSLQGQAQQNTIATVFTLSSN